MRHKIAIQMDDIRNIDYAYDSSFMIGLEGQKRNYELFVYHPNDLFLDSNVMSTRYGTLPWTSIGVVINSYNNFVFELSIFQISSNIH